MEKLYKAIAIGLNKRELIEYNDDYKSQLVSLIENNPGKDLYESLYLYDEQNYAQFKKTHSLAGIKNIKTDRLVFDFDSKSDINLAKNDAIEVVSRLENYFPKNYIKIFYSGNKGFHVEVELKDLLSRKQFENVTRNLSEGLSTFDQKVSDEQRIFRIPLSTHIKTDRMKIPLTITQLKSYTISSIEKMASGGYKDEYGTLLDSYGAIGLPDALKFQAQEEPIREILTITDTPDLTRRRKEISPAKFVLEEGFFEEGERNEACMILASTYRHLGYNKEMAYNMLKATLRLRAARLGRPDYDKNELWLTVVEPVYSPTWKGGTYSENDGLLKKTIDRYNLNKATVDEGKILSLVDVLDKFKDFATNIDKNTIKLGLPSLDDKVRITTSMLTCLLAAPGAGKTTLSFNILNGLSKAGTKAMFFSLDMGSDLVIQRIIQKHTGKHSDTIFNDFKNGNKLKIEEYARILTEEYKNIKFVFQSGLTTQHIREMIISERDRTGECPKMILIDYLENIAGPFSDSTANKALIARELKDIANEFSINVFLLVQPTKHAGDPSYELNSYTDIKGSSVIQEAASVILTMYRPGFDPDHDDDHFATIKVVKNRMGSLGSFDFGWEGLTGRIYELDEDGHKTLKALREEISKRRATKDSGDAW